MGQQAQKTARAVALMERFLPPRIRTAGAVERRRARLLVAFTIAVVLVGGPSAALYYWQGSPRAALIVVLAAAVAPALLFVMRQTSSTGLATNLGIGALYGCLTGLSLSLGGAHAPTLLWFAAIPLLAISLAGRPATIVWSVLAVVSAVALQAAQRLGFFAPSGLDAVTPGLTQATALAGLMVLALLLVILLESLGGRAFEELEQERAFSGHVINSLPGVFYLFNRRGRYLRWNDDLLRVTGYNAAELAAMRPTDLFRGPDRHLIAAAIRQVLETGEAAAEAELTTKDGRQIPYFFTGRRVEVAGETCIVGMGVDISERRRVEQALREREQRFQDITENSREWIWEIDADRCYTYCNSVVERILGYRPEELLGKHFWELFHPDERAELKRAAEEVFGQRRPFRGFVNRNVHKSGRSVWLSTSGVPVLDADGRLVGYRGADIDITERLLAEEAARAREIRLQRQNQVWMDLSRSKTIAQGDLRAALRRITEAAARTLGVERVGVWLFSEDGRRLRCHDLYEASLNRHSENTELEMTCRQACCRALEENRTIAAHDAQADPRTREFRRDYLGPLGISSTLDVPIRIGSEVVGVVCHEHVGPARQWTLDEQHFAGSLADFVALTIEADERRRAEARLREHADLLAAKNQELRAQRQELLAANRALAEARSAAEAANRAKSHFLANMSHEIRTPLTAVLGFAETLLEPGLSERDRHDAVRAIRSNSDHLLQIINDILDIARIEAGQLTVERLACSVVAVVTEVAELMRPHAAAKHLKFEVDYVTSLPETIPTDPTRLRQILLNLVGNAIKFTERGNVLIRLAWSDGRHGPPGVGPRLRLQVIDTGIGMTAEQVRRVFEPFTQADETTTRKYGGTGLGLAISRRLAELLGGRLSVVSVPRQGSTFTLELPTGRADNVRLIDPRSQVRHPAEEQPTPSETRLPRLSGRILLAEDGVDNQRLLVLVLSKAGAEVTAVDNGQLAVERALAAQAEGRPFDVILMDMQMPVMDGYQATRLLRQRGYTGAVIALTAHAMRGDRERCLAAGCDDYLAKPIERKTLFALLKRYVAEAPAAANHAAEPAPGRALRR